MSCIACGGARERLVIGGTELDSCRHCGTATLAEIPVRDDYWLEPLDHVPSFWTEAKARYFSSALELLERQVVGGRLLDVGGGVGYFARLALDRGWDAASLDASSEATRHAAKVLGQDRALERLQDARASSYDAVTMWCVLAHVPDPFSLVSEVREKVRPGGILWITTPNFTFQRPYARVRARLGKPIDFASDDHLHQFTPAGLERIALRAGLDPWTWHYRGITDFCALTGSTSSSLLRGKRIWNRMASAVMQVGGPNLTSELQGLTRRPR